MNKKELVLLYFFLGALQRGHNPLAVASARDRIESAAGSMIMAWDAPPVGKQAADLILFLFEGGPAQDWFRNYVDQFKG